MHVSLINFCHVDSLSCLWSSEMAENSKAFIISDESKDILVSKVKDLEFVDGQSQLQGCQCYHCKSVAIRHCIASCKHVFCQSCYKLLKQKPCPVCDSFITESKQNEEFERMVFKLKVVCEFKKNGCQMIVSLGDFLDHIKDCRLATQNYLTKAYKADAQAKTLELINANFKDIKNVMQDLQTENKQLRDAMVEMMKENIKQMTELTKQLLFRLDRLESQMKCQLKVKQSKSTDIFNSSTIREIQILPRDPDSPSDSPLTTFNWTISEVREKMTTSTYRQRYGLFAVSEEFSIPSHGLNFRAKLERGSDGSLMEIHLYFTWPSRATSSPFLHSRKYLLVDQSNCEEKQDIVLLDQPRFGQNTTKAMTDDYFCHYCFFPIPLLGGGDKYVKNDKMLIRIILEPISVMFKMISSMDGTLLSRIDNYTKRKQEEMDGIRAFLISGPFYTSDKGYRIDMEIYLNGLGTNIGKGISIRPMFRIGEWDDAHTYPLKFTYKRLLMDQSNAPTKRDISYESPVFNCESYYCLDDFQDIILHEAFETLTYLKDDSLLLQFVVNIL